MADQIEILVVSNAGDGCNERKGFASGTTVMDLFRMYAGSNALPADFKVRVNGEKPANATYVMQQGDRFSITPSKVAGA